MRVKIDMKSPFTVYFPLIFHLFLVYLLPKFIFFAYLDTIVHVLPMILYFIMGREFFE